MWFDVQAALADIHAGEKRLSNTTPRATCATMATQAAETLPVSHMSPAPHDLESANDTAPWGAADWRMYFDERSAVAEFDGGLSRHEAEQQAWRCCVSEWLSRNFEASEPGSCAWCQRGDLLGRMVMPYGDAGSGHVWLHGECWAAWWAKRSQAAVAALKAVGLHEGSYSA